MTLFDKFHPLAVAREEMTAQCPDFFHITMEEILSPTEALIKGRPTLLAGTNNYLGLTFHPDCIAAACEATEKEGTGTTGSRMANGTYAGHLALEQELSTFFGRKRTIVFSTGYLANLALLSTLTGQDDVILLDADCHASIYDGCRMGSAEVIRFRHNDVADLEKRLRRLGGRKANVLIVVEGIYSMLGDQAPLKEIAALKQQYGAWLAVDEAHSLGVLGEHGRGLAEACGVEGEVDFVIGTFSKSLGAIGGFCSSNHDGLDFLRYASRPYIFTASLSPATIASTRAALRVLAAEPFRRTLLWQHARLLYAKLKAMGYKVGPEAGPVIAVRAGKPADAFRLWQGLLDQGVYVNMVLPPATPDGGALLRCSLSAAHSTEQVEAIATAFAARKGLIP
ncbi:MAG: aminotransferase class I/II-fold pyridoxal phosphate-dependent enzyme [bacterium]|nr:aminotransferase class I/II-fold pyridoxal phosphate-dependent enzyme [bacterium]